MKKIIAAGILYAISIATPAQEKDSISINLLNAPSNPAFNLMGIATSSVERPTDLNAFRLSLQNATNNFSKLPSTYAIELSPAAIFNAKDQTFKKFNSQKFKDYFLQTLSISFGFTKSDMDDKEIADSSSFSKLGIGLKFSFIRPKWTGKTQKLVDSFYTLQAMALDNYEKQKEVLFSSSIEYNKLLEELSRVNSLPSGTEGKEERILELNAQGKHIRDSIFRRPDDKINEQFSIIYDSLFKSSVDELKKFSQSNLKVERKGGFLDFASGIVIDFPDDRFNYSLVGKAGVWLTGGYEGGNKGVSVLGVGRLLFQPDKIFADESGVINSSNISTFDAGARILYSSLKGKFTLSTEAVYRSVLKKNTIAPSWRLVFNTEYDIGKNQKLTFAFGRNFDGTIDKSGNIIAALNFIQGLGDRKDFSK